MRVASSRTWFRGTLEQTDHGLVAGGDGWYVLNARASRWYYATGRGAFCDLEGEQTSPRSGSTSRFSSRGEAMAMYHWEADQEDLVVAGDALLIIGEERPLRQWDFVHCPPNAKHTIVGAGTGPCIVVAVGARAAPGRPRLGRLHGRRGRPSPRSRCRAGDDRP